MPSSSIQMRSGTNDESGKSSNNKLRNKLKPIQPTQLWTFDNALSLLKSCSDPYILDALDEYLLLNNTVILNPSPFTSNDKEEIYKGKDLSLRNILYTDITSNNLKDSERISKFLKIQNKETLRIIKQTCTRIPEKKINNYEKLKSKLPDDREKYLEDERTVLYTSRILKERRIVLSIVIELLNNKLNPAASTIVQNLGKNIYLSDTYIDQLIDNLSSTASSLINESYKTEISDELDQLIYTENLLFIIDSLKVLVELLYNNVDVKKESTKKWFDFMKLNNFALSLGPHIIYTESFALIQGIITVISIMFLNLDDDFDINDKTSYSNDAQIVKSLNDTITDKYNTNSIIIYAWALVLMKKSIIIEDFLESNPPSALTNFTQTFSQNDIQSTMNELNSRLSSSEVFDSLSKLNDLLRFDNIYASILSSLILSIMPLISISPEISLTISKVLRNAPNSMIQKFYDNESTINNIILSRAKFPILLTPYLRLSAINGNFALHEFQELKSYISIFNKSEFSRLYDIDDANTDLIKLKESIDLYPPFEINKKLSLVLNKNTKGQILPTSNKDEILVTFLYKYNGWSFLGRILQNVSKIFDSSDNTKIEFITDILGLINQVVEDNSVDEAKLVLEAMSAYTDDSDIIEVILRIFEQGLHSRNIDILEPLVNLLCNLMPFFSYRIWPYLSKSSLLSSNGKEGFASTIFGAIEMVKGDYKFTLSLIRLVESLTQNCLSLEDEYPEKLKSAVLSRLINHLVLVFESFVHCRFNEAYQKLEVGVLILDIFSNILIHVYGIDSDVQPNEKITKVFADSSITILDTFLVTNSDYSRSSYPILAMIDTLSSNINIYQLSDISSFWYDNWIRCSLNFAQLIITIRSSLSYNPSTFEKSLFTKLPQLVITYAHFETYRKPVLDLITALTNGKWNNEPSPSLLSHLGRDYAHVLLNSLASDLDNSFDDYKMKISLYDFICAVMDGNQEGLSVLFISGKDVFGEFTKSKINEKNNEKPISLLNTLKKNVSDMKYYPNDVSLHLVDAIALAFNSWTTARESENDIGFVNELISRTKNLLNKSPSLINDYVSLCYELKLISKIVEILSLFLFTTNNETCKQSIIKYITSKEFTDSLEGRFSLHDYLPALHNETHRSFESAFPNMKLSQFTTALLKRNRFGMAGIYNFALMDTLFKDKQQWLQIREHLIASSINLQYLNSQIASAKSFGALLTAFCRKCPNSLNASHLKFVSKLLSINVSEGIPAELFSEVHQERIELAFFLLYSINNSDIEKSPVDVFEIIKVTSELLSSSSMNFVNNLTGHSTSYRSLLRIIYISLSLIKNEFTLIIEYFSVFRDLFGLIITKGIRTISIDLQNDVYLSRTKKNHTPTQVNDRLDDLQLILSILKVFVTLKTSSNLQYEMATLVTENDTIKSLLNLYSFSHLIEVNDEFLFAQLSLMFIQKLLTIDVIAETFFSAGLLIVLVQASISQPIKKGGISINSAPQYHRIWSNGLLPIFITILSKLGPKIIPELCCTLQSFGKQVEFCIESWAKDSSSIKINTALVSETSQILLLYQLLKSLNVSDFLDKRHQMTSGGGVVDMYIFQGLDTEAKRYDFIDCINNLLKHPKFLSSRITPSSIEEQRIIEKGDIAYSQLAKDIISDIGELKDFDNTD